MDNLVRVPNIFNLRFNFKSSKLAKKTFSIQQYIHIIMEIIIISINNGNFFLLTDDK